MFDYTVSTSKSIEQAMEDLEQNLKNVEFGVLWQLAIHDKLAEKGIELDQTFHVLEVCNPKVAQEVLTQNTMMGYFLPCKMVVYSEDGQTKIGMPKPTVLAEHVGDAQITPIVEDVEQRMKQAMDQTV